VTRRTSFRCLTARDRVLPVRAGRGFLFGSGSTAILSCRSGPTNTGSAHESLTNLWRLGQLIGEGRESLPSGCDYLLLSVFGIT